MSLLRQEEYVLNWGIHFGGDLFDQIQKSKGGFQECTAALIMK